MQSARSAESGRNGWVRDFARGESWCTDRHTEWCVGPVELGFPSRSTAYFDKPTRLGHRQIHLQDPKAVAVL
jgi:hypothetical protein